MKESVEEKEHIHKITKDFIILEVEKLLGIIPVVAGWVITNAPLSAGVKISHINTPYTPLMICGYICFVFWIDYIYVIMHPELHVIFNPFQKLLRPIRYFFPPK